MLTASLPSVSFRPSSPMPLVRKRAPREREPQRSLRRTLALSALAVLLAGLAARTLRDRFEATEPSAPRRALPAERTATRPTPTVRAPASAPAAPVAQDPRWFELNPAASWRRARQLSAGVPRSGEVLFTFDDGPRVGATERILELLARHHVHAVFFVLGEALERGPHGEETPERALVRRMIAEGHLVANHSYSHPRLSRVSAAELARQIERTDQLLEELTGARPVLFRPPYGDGSARVRARLRAERHLVWLWNIDSRDWALHDDAAATARGTLEQLAQTRGGTVLMHDIHSWTAEALETVLHSLEGTSMPGLRAVEPRAFFERARARVRARSAR